MTELAGADRVAPGAVEAWRRRLGKEVDADSPRGARAGLSASGIPRDRGTRPRADVVGVPSERWGEAVVAYIIPAEGREVDHEELTAHARERLSAHKCPKWYFTIEQLPRNEMGRVLRDELVHMAGEEPEYAT